MIGSDYIKDRLRAAIKVHINDILKPGATVEQIDAMLATALDDVLIDVWTTADVRDHAEQIGYVLTEDQAIEVLYTMTAAHNANVGYSWNSVTSSIESLGYQEEPEEEDTGDHPPEPDEEDKKEVE